MNSAMMAIGAVLILASAAFLILFNRMVRLRNKVDGAWHQIDVQLQRRYDLLPQLADAVKRYAAHEKGTFEAVGLARARAIGASGVAAQGPAEDNLSAAIGGVLAVAEAYPDLKANAEFLKYQMELATTENHIAGSRKYYNGAVMYYNNARESFPGNVVRVLLPRTFASREYFEIADPVDRLAPPVSGTGAVRRGRPLPLP